MLLKSRISQSLKCFNASKHTDNMSLFELQAEGDYAQEELISPTNIKKEKDEEERRKATNNEESSNSNSNSNRNSSSNSNINSNSSSNSNDSYAQFGQSVANHLRESNLSKGKLLVLQGEILATIAKHVA